ncbi:MAG: type II secretion system F family protein [Bacteroidota bacterium]
MAVKEFKFAGVGRNAQPVQGTVFAPSKRSAEQKVAALADKHNFRTQGLMERRTFMYKVKHPNGTVIKGEQKAYTEDEIRKALSRMGLEVLKVEKKLFDLPMKPPSQDIIMFVRLASNLLREKLPFDEILTLLSGDVNSKPLKQTLRDLNGDLKGGMDAQSAFMKHQHTLGKFTAYMLGIASQSGNMSEIYEATARFLERQNEFKKSVRSAMITPLITIVILLAVILWYIWDIFPKTAGLLEDVGMPLPPMTASTMEFSYWLDANWWWLLTLIAAMVGALIWYVRTPKGQFRWHKIMISMPIIGALLHKLNIEIFCRVFSVLYSGSGENIQVMRIASEACGNAYMEHQIKTVTIPMMVGQGAGLVQSMEASNVFTPMAIARFRSGAETGSVRNSAQQMADYYESETKLKLKSVVESIQTGVSVFITAAIIFLTLVSTEVAMVQPSAEDMMNQRVK